MLEFPSLVFILLAVHSIRDLSRFTLWRGLAFVLLAGAALARRWHLLADKAIWITAALAILPVAGLSMFSSLFRGTGTDQVVQSQVLGRTILHHVEFYWESTAVLFELAGASLLVAGVACALVITLRGQPKSGLALHLAWASSAFAVLLLLGPYDPRYLFSYIRP